MTQHVVIVDDDDLSLKLFTSIAGEIPDVVVHAFRSSTEALEWCHGKDVDLFVFDYNMPAPNGLQMIWAIRALPDFALVPIVLVTGAHEREVRYKALDGGATDFLQKPVDLREMVARLTTLLRLQAAQKRLAMQVGSLEVSLLDAEERSRHHAERLEALWRIANNPSLQDDRLIQAMLEHGAAGVRPGHPFRGLLARFEKGGLRLEWATEARGYSDEAGAGADSVGRFIAIDDADGPDALQSSVTRSWEDIQATNDVTPLLLAYDWRAVIRTTFTAGASSYLLAFVSNQPATKPFGPQDHAYVEVLASFFAAHRQQQWQSTRIAHQLEHDSLTGLLNRSRFRSLGRAGFHPGGAQAIAVVDLTHFHEVNETYGHLIGDAVLVEVAAALAGAAREGEIVARVGGDSFGIFFPAVASRAWLEARVATFGAVFDIPMGLGDREGKDTLSVSGHVGVGVAPADGKTFDELLFRAEGRAGTTVRAG
jgi:diguanylate cyclase (GGDEF)-like protein